MSFEYDRIVGLELECNCTQVTEATWDELMESSIRASKKKINQLARDYLPNLFDYLSLDLYNPYVYYRTKKHLILVHSGIEYFLEFHF